MDAVDDAATKSFPRYFHFYADRAELLQQWLGDAGELENYTQSLLDNPAGEDGQIAYTYAASRLSFQYSREDIFAKTGLVWSQVKNAYATRQKLYGLNNHDWNVFLELAVSGNDKPAAIEALSHIGNDWDKAVWRDKVYSILS